MGRTLVLNRNSLAVGLEHDHLIVHDHAKAGDVPVRVPLVSVDRVIVSGQPAVTFAVLAKLMDMHIPCSFLTHGGRWRGVMDGDPGFHAGRRFRQYESLSEEDFGLRFTARLIAAKIKNSRRTLQRLASGKEHELQSDPDWAGLNKCLGALGYLRTLDALRGMEGCAAACYFRVLSHYFPEDAPFEERSRRPPRNSANALLSFVYTLLANEVVEAVRTHGLDVAAGYLHRGRDRAPALALDLMEPYRPGFADRLVLDLLNHRRIRADAHFRLTEDGGVYLSDDGRAIVLRAFEEALARCIDSDVGRISMRQQIDRDVCSFIAMLEQGTTPCFYLAA